MIKIKDSVPTTPSAKRTITAKGVSIVNGVLVDEDGDIIPKIKEVYQ